MKVYFFTRDIQTGLIYAGCKAEKRFISAVWKQGNEFYVTTGAVITKDMRRYNFSENQAKAFCKFVASGSYNFEDMTGIE